METENKAIEALRQQEAPVKLKAFKAVQQKSPNIKVLGWGSKEFFGNVRIPNFLRLDPLDDVTEMEVPQFLLSKFKWSLSEQNLPTPDQLNRTVFFNHSETVIDQNILLCDDFFNFQEEEKQKFLGGLNQLSFLLPDGFFTTGVPKVSGIATLSASSEPIFSLNSMAHHPMGNRATTEFLAFALDAYVTVFNSTAWQVLQQFIGLANKSRMDGEKFRDSKQTNYDEIVLEQRSSDEFLALIKDLKLVMHYPDPRSSDPAVQNAGMAFLCQVLYWLEPERYEKVFLMNPKASEIKEAVEKVFNFLDRNPAYFKSEDSFDKILQLTRRNNILMNLPTNFNLEDSFGYQDLPAEYHLLDTDFRLSFGFLPESYFVEQYAEKSKYLKNAAILEELKAKKLAKIKLREERERQKKLRKKKSRAGASGTETKDEEPQSSEDDSQGEDDGEDEDMKEDEVTDLTRMTQLTSMIVGKAITRRYYLAIPKNAREKMNALYFANCILQRDTQKALTMNPMYLRSVNPELDSEVYIPKISLKKGGKKAQYTMQIFLPQADFKARLLPILGPFYQTALESKMKGI